MMKKIAVMFPGMGYTCVKPLLYYTACAAAEHGYEVVRLDYGEDIHGFKGRNMEELEPLIRLAADRALPQLREIPWQEYSQIIFISKSIGTAVACMTAESLGISAYQFLMTPIPAVMPYLECVEGKFFAGTSDPCIEPELVSEMAEKYPQKVGRIFDKCNHSLERKGDILAGIDNLRFVVESLIHTIMDIEGERKVLIRAAHGEEADELAAIEAVCFPAAEAAKEEDIKKRMKAFPENFLVAEADGKIVGFINGCTTDKPILGDELYHDAGLHRPDGDIQTVFGLDVLPEYRGRGIARALLRELIEMSRSRGKSAVILTCKEHLIPFYESCGFCNRGVADSEHGGALWYDMQLWFGEDERHA